MIFLKNLKTCHAFTGAMIFTLCHFLFFNTCVSAQSSSHNLKKLTVTESADGSLKVEVEAAKGSTNITPATNSKLNTVVVPRNIFVAGTLSSCGDGFCAKDKETLLSCAQDCDRCADKVCSPTENCSSCPGDCGSCVCGDNQCIGETCSGCPADCSPCCGDGACQGGSGETCSNCSGDCGSCSGPPCFLAGTLITMADGSTKPIETIEMGDMVLSFDEQTRTMKPDKVVKILFHPQENNFLIINNHLKVTPEHRVLSQGQWLDIGSLKIGDTLTNTQGSEVPIESIEIVKETVDVYNFEVNPYHTYVAEGYIVHNSKDPFCEANPFDPGCIAPEPP